MDNYTIIQNSLITNIRLSDGAYRLHILLQAMAYGTKTTVFPSQKYMSVSLGRSVRTIQRYLKELVRNSLISIRRRGSTSSLITILSKKAQQASNTITNVVKKVYSSFKGQNSGKSNAKNNKPSNWNIQSRNYNFLKLENALLYGTNNDFEELLE